MASRVVPNQRLSARLSDAWRMRPRGRTTWPLSTITSSLDRSIASTTGPFALTTTTAGFVSKLFVMNALPQPAWQQPARKQISRRINVELVSTLSLAVGPAEADGHEAALAALVAAVLVRLLLEPKTFVEPLRPVAP